MSDIVSVKRASRPSTPNGNPILAMLDDATTPMGRLTLRRRRSVALDGEVYEMHLNGKLVMSSAVTVSEQALADSALKSLRADSSVLIGGLGLGFTAIHTLAQTNVAKVTVVEALEEVVGWHQREMFPWSASLISDKRLSIVHDNFFEFIQRDESVDRYDALLIDIDDVPDDTWHPDHQPFYSLSGLRIAQRCLRPNGVLALWCAIDPPDHYLQRVQEVFGNCRVEHVTYIHPCFHQPDVNVLVHAVRQYEP